MNNNDVLELEKILNQEIEAYSKLDEYITEKRCCLINGDINKVIEVDTELQKYNSAVEKLDKKRREIYPEDLTLKDIIEKIENKEQAKKISTLREKVKTLILKVQKQNFINNELIKHSLKIVESSIISIANVLIPESAAYNIKGAIKTNSRLSSISSVEHEV